MPKEQNAIYTSNHERTQFMCPSENNFAASRSYGTWTFLYFLLVFRSKYVNIALRLEFCWNTPEHYTFTVSKIIFPWSWRGRAIPLLPLWAVRPVQSLSAYTRV